MNPVSLKLNFLSSVGVVPFIYGNVSRFIQRSIIESKISCVLHFIGAIVAFVNLSLWRGLVCKFFAANDASSLIFNHSFSPLKLCLFKILFIFNASIASFFGILYPDCCLVLIVQYRIYNSLNFLSSIVSSLYNIYMTHYIMGRNKYHILIREISRIKGFSISYRRLLK